MRQLGLPRGIAARFGGLALRFGPQSGIGRGLRLEFRFGLCLGPGFGLDLGLQLCGLAGLGLGGCLLLGLMFGEGLALKLRLASLLFLQACLALGFGALLDGTAGQFGFARGGSGFLLTLALLLLQCDIGFLFDLGGRGPWVTGSGLVSGTGADCKACTATSSHSSASSPRGEWLCHCTPKYRKASSSRCVNTASANALSVPRSRTGS